MSKIQIRRGLASDWTVANPILGSGEFGYETDTGKVKIGNGTTTWTGLVYYNGGKQGAATLVAGTATVANTSIAAGSRIMLTTQSLGTVTVPKALAVTARVVGTSFTITSADATDTSVVAYNILD